MNIDDAKLENSIGLLSQDRQKKIQNKKVERDKKLSFAAGMALREALLEKGIDEKKVEYCYSEHGKPYIKESEKAICNVAKSGNAVCNATEIENDVYNVAKSENTVCNTTEIENDICNVAKSENSIYNATRLKNDTYNVSDSEVKAMYFNISHSGEYAVAAVSEYEIGIDIEKIRPYRNGVAKRCFSEKEKELLQNRNEKEKIFFYIWTLKEAYLKATGEGITRDLSGVETYYNENDGCAYVKSEDDRAYAKVMLDVDGYVISICSFEPIEKVEIVYL